MRGNPTLRGALLPTPRSSDQNGAGVHGQGGMDLRTAMQMLPTPCARDWKGEGYEGQLPTEMVKLLPTPVSSGDSVENPRDPTPTLSDLAYKWSGGRTVRQSNAGKRSSAGLVLSPSFVEWMMGAPAGWSDPDCPLSATEFSSRPDGCSER